MAKYVNKSSEMRTIYFEDGSAKFLRRGQSVSTTKKVKRVQDGIVVKNDTKKKTEDTSEQ